MEQMLLTGFSMNQIKWALVQSSGELNAAMNMILEGKAPDNDPKAEWDAFIAQLDRAQKQAQDIKSGVISQPKKKWDALKDIGEIIQRLHELTDQYGAVDDVSACFPCFPAPRPALSEI